MYEGNIMDYFPLEKARAGQIAVINEIDKVFKSGKKLVILEGPVGCGKSAIGMTFAKAFTTSHLITPRKSLQNQYFEDFSNDVVLMKGRAAYPCTYNASKPAYNKVIDAIKNGRIKQPTLNEPNCATGPCRESKEVYNECVARNGECPYQVAMSVAQNHPSVIHNVHSFIFQTSFTEKFEKRELLVIDEAHDIQGVVREFISSKLTINKVIESTSTPTTNDLDDWCNFFESPEYVPLESATDVRMKAEDKDYKSPKDEYLKRVKFIRDKKNYYNNKFIIKTTQNSTGNRVVSTGFEFIPEHLGNAVENLLLSFGEYVILMSGTIYGKDTFCRNLGIDPSSAHYIRISSTFPVSNRPIILKPEYQVDTSFANWNENFPEMIEKIKKIISIFGDAKGLIHAPSYETADAIFLALNDPRIVKHGKTDFQDKLETFFSSEGNQVFISPVCQQGVDFKDDRARFQIIIRVPYPNTSDEFVKFKVENDFNWYNQECLITFGQQLGRINRSENDYGCTFCLDSRFNKFLIRNSGKIPKWVQSAYVWK